MDKLIDELRAQRDQIQKHLNWIDRKILEAEIQQTTQEAPTNQPDQLVPKSRPLSDLKTSHIDAPESHDEPNPEKFATAPGQGDVTNAKVGCIVLFLLGTGLFVFLLFGLPYLLD